MPRYGIDSSMFVRLLTGDPAAEIEVSNLVIR